MYFKQEVNQQEVVPPPQLTKKKKKTFAWVIVGLQLQDVATLLSTQRPQLR